MTPENPFATHWETYDAWFDEYPALYELELEAIRSLLPEEKPDRSLEIGVGTGRFFLPLQFTDGVEPAENLVARLQAQGHSIVCAAAESLPYPDETFGVVGLFTVLEFVQDPQLALREIARVLKPDGTVLLAFLNRSSPEGKCLVEQADQILWYRNAHFYTQTELIQLLNQEGYRVTQGVQLVGEGLLPITARCVPGLYTVLQIKKQSCLS